MELDKVKACDGIKYMHRKTQSHKMQQVFGTFYTFYCLQIMSLPIAGAN